MVYLSGLPTCGIILRIKLNYIQSKGRELVNQSNYAYKFIYKYCFASQRVVFIEDLTQYHFPIPWVLSFLFTYKNIQCFLCSYSQITKIRFVCMACKFFIGVKYSDLLILKYEIIGYYEQ